MLQVLRQLVLVLQLLVGLLVPLLQQQEPPVGE
jgi:hypothetical protein